MGPPAAKQQILNNECMLLDTLLSMQKIEISKDLFISTPPPKLKDQLVDQNWKWELWAESKNRNKVALRVNANSSTGIWFLGLAVSWGN